MPQLAPMNWIALFSFSVALLLLVSVLIWWFYFPQFSLTSPSLSTNQHSWSW